MSSAKAPKEAVETGPFRTVRADDIPDMPDAQLLPEGFMDLAVRRQEATTSKRTSQGMVRLTLAAGFEGGDGENVYLDNSPVSLFLMSPFWEDDDLFRHGTAEKLAAKMGRSVEELHDAHVDRAIAKAQADTVKRLSRQLRVLFPEDANLLAPAPTYIAGKPMHPESGDALSRVEAADLWREHYASCVNLLTAIANEEVDLSGFVVVGRIKHEIFNNQKRANLADIYSELPHDAVEVPVEELEELFA